MGALAPKTPRWRAAPWAVTQIFKRFGYTLVRPLYFRVFHYVMPIRYSDFIKRSDKINDFVSRNYNPSLVKLLVYFFATLAAGITITALVLPPLYFIISMTLVMAGLGSWVIISVQQLRDLLVSTEYQNAMFASALGYNSRFCIIIKREGTIVYMDGGLHKMFPDILKERQLSLSNLLKMARVPLGEREKVLDLVQHGTPDKILLDMRSADNRAHSVVLSVQPILRPSGFLLIRGRDYVEERGGGSEPKPVQAPVSNPLLSKSSISMFAHIMDRMGMGLYMIDMGGNMLYANPVLEKWLAFAQGDIIDGNFTLRDVVHGVSVEAALNPGDFEGENLLLKKQGGIIKAYINQKIIYGDNNKPLGCVALITNMVEDDAELKKRLW